MIALTLWGLASGSVPRGTDRFFPAQHTLSPPAVGADSAAADTGRSALPYRLRSYWVSPLFPRRVEPLVALPLPGSVWRHEVRPDSTYSRMTARETVSGLTVRIPLTVDYLSYRQERLRYDLARTWRELLRLRQQEQAASRGLLDLRIEVPGGRSSAFSTLFGAPTVSLRVNGQADIDLGLSIQNNRDPNLPPQQQKRIDPLFGQNIRLGISGGIGDKLTVSTDWDTQRMLDFENRLKLQYIGYEDEIIKRIEAGNVSLQTPSQLISGGQALFGIRSDLQLGPVRLSTVFSQQDGERARIVLDGGVEENVFELKATDYEDDTHFFLGFYFRNRWGIGPGQAFSRPPTILAEVQITDVEVWVLRQSQQRLQENERDAVALLELGEAGESRPPDPALDRFSDAVLERLRLSNQVTDILERELGVSPRAYVQGTFLRLEPGRDYTFDPNLGYISLRTSLSNFQAVAVAYRYVDASGRLVEVGDFARGGGSSGSQINRLVLKLIRPTNPVPGDPSWDLVLRNIYRLPGSNFRAGELQLDVVYRKPGLPESRTLPGLDIRQRDGRPVSLLQLTGLDRLNDNQAPQPDDRFDFLPGYTINEREGRLLFPVLEPFGSTLRQAIYQAAAERADLKELENTLVFDALYRETRVEARRDPRDVYFIKGRSRGSARQQYSLGAGLGGVVEGSIRVLSGGVLVPPSAYTVDYITGTITFTDPTYLQPGRQIIVEFEQQKAFRLQQKTLLGLRADYDAAENLKLGATFLQLGEQPIADKNRIGEEPVRNLIWGLDGNYTVESRWLTRLLDVLPLVQTKAPSKLQVRGEVAQLVPGFVSTALVRQTQERLRREGYPVPPDERRGVSYIDDFEGVRSAVSLLSPGIWRLASLPDSIGRVRGSTAFDDSLKTTWRAWLSWYAIPIQLYGQDKAPLGPETWPIQQRQLFPERQVQRGQDYLQTFDLWYLPGERGPYNYNRDLAGFKADPRSAWAGIMTRIPDGYNNFEINNIEFLEFWFAPQLRPGDRGRLYIDIGYISEDVIPNGQLNTEDGLDSTSNSFTRDPWGKVSRGIKDQLLSNDPRVRAYEDVGLDGMRDEEERLHFRDFLEAVRRQFGENSPEYQRLWNDPSADNYRYYLDPTLPAEVGWQERFRRYFPGLEGNTPLAQSGILGSTKFPDTEDLNGNNALDTRNAYFQYELELDPEQMQPGRGYVVDRREVEIGGVRQTWYLVRIPLAQYRRRVGDIRDFKVVEALRFWLTGFSQPVTLRFATLELVGSQWTRLNVGTQNPDTRFEVATINIEENATRTPIPYKSPPGAIRPVDRTTLEQIQRNEQALLLRVQNLYRGDERAIFKTFGGLNLLRYSNLRMDVHGEGYEKAEEAELFVRIGSDLLRDYYEYRQPVKPTPLLPGGASAYTAELLWPAENRVNILLDRLNQLKQLRDERGIPEDSLFGAPELLDYEDVPPGAGLYIRGRPSLSQVTKIAVGIRNPRTGRAVLNAEFWINELRVTGFDARSGWAAVGSASLQLADLAQLDFSLDRRTAGFGSVESRLEERGKEDRFSWSLNTRWNLERFYLARYGWQIPLSVTWQQSRTTPTYAPGAGGDVQLVTIRRLIERDTTLDPALRRMRVDSLYQAARTQRQTRSIALPSIRKSGSTHPLGRYLLDPLGVQFSYVEEGASSPTLIFDRRWQWSTTAQYQLTLPRLAVVRPFRFLEGVPVLDLLADLRLNYLPSSLSLQAGLSRQLIRTQDRPTTGDLRQQPGLPLEAIKPVRETHQLQYREGMGLQYNPFPFLGLGYTYNGQTSLAALGVDTIYVTLQDTVRLRRLRVLSERAVWDRLWGRYPGVRPETYTQSFSATFTPRFSAYPALRWLVLSGAYTGDFLWNNGPAGDSTGAQIGNQADWRINGQLRIGELWSSARWYQELQAWSRGGSRASEPLWKQLWRRVLFALTSLRQIDLSFTQRQQARNAGFAGPAGLRALFADDPSRRSPSLAYRLGWERTLDPQQRVRVGGVRFLDSWQQTRQIGARTSLSLLPELRLDLNWDGQWQGNLQSTVTFDPMQRRFQEATTREGQTTLTTWGLRGSYGRFFRAQWARLQADGIQGGEVRDRDGDGFVVGSNASLLWDFQRIFGGPFSGVRDRYGMLVLPLPNWQVVWTGLERLWILRRLVSSIVLRHGYVGQYQASWRANLNAGAPFTYRIGGIRVYDTIPAYEGRDLSIAQRFAPLIGLSLTWKGDVRTELTYNQARIVSLSFSNANVNIRRVAELSFRTSYRRSRFRLPFSLFGIRSLDNDVTIGLAISFSQEVRDVYYLSQDLDEALSGALRIEDLRPRTSDGSARWVIEPTFGYTFSSRVTAEFRWRIEDVAPRGSSRVTPSTTQQIGFKIRVGITS
jgi:cell surface protein SprA